MGSQVGAASARDGATPARDAAVDSRFGAASSPDGAACWHPRGPEALAELYRRHAAVALQFARRVVRDPHLAEDVAQQALVKALRAIGRFEHRCTFRTWLYRVTVNEAIAVLRRRMHTESPAALVPAAGTAPDTPEELAQRNAEREAVRAAITRLDPALRAAVVYRYYLDLNEAEIASRLGCPVGTVKSRLHRARQQLRTVLQLMDKCPTTPVPVASCLIHRHRPCGL